VLRKLMPIDGHFLFIKSKMLLNKEEEKPCVWQARSDTAASMCQQWNI